MDLANAGGVFVEVFVVMYILWGMRRLDFVNKGLVLYLLEFTTTIFNSQQFRFYLPCFALVTWIMINVLICVLKSTYILQSVMMKTV